MCGICGIVSTEHSMLGDQTRLLAMRDIIAHRGPDDAGVYEDACVRLGSRRLAILDLSAAGHMPMASPDGRYWIAYNGECYNFQALRPALEAQGYTFRSHSDTEVLLYLYMEHGTDMLHWINGMFSIAIWDSVECELFVARDRLGVKPVYYCQEGGSMLFASEQKALFAAGVVPKFDPATWEELLCFRYTAGERTPFLGVKRLLPGYYLTWKDGEIQVRRWWNLSERVRELRSAPPADPSDWFRRVFDDAVRLRLIADVPVGVLLSGGLDSSSIAASLSAAGAKAISSYTVRFDEPGYDEGPYAKLVADQLRLEHHDLFVPERDIPELLLKSTWLLDEPLAHANDPFMYAISKFAKARVTVLLSGEGADELMGGYVRYRPLRFKRLLKAARPLLTLANSVLPKGGNGSLPKRLRKLTRLLGEQESNDMQLFNACEVFPSELAALGLDTSDPFAYRREVLEEACVLYPNDPMRQTMYLDCHTFLTSILDRNDRTTMGASIECRVPYLDYRLVEGLFALPSSVLLAGWRGKRLLRSVFSSLLPPKVIRHRKWGFSVPWHVYFRNEPTLRRWVERVPDLEPVRSGPFDQLRVRSMIDGYLQGDSTHEAIVRQLILVTLWYRACVEGAVPGAITLQAT